MARNLPLVVVRQMVKAETEKSLDVSDTSQNTEINQIISDVQEQLAATYNWPFLKTRWDSNLAASTRFQTFPTISNLGNTSYISHERPLRVDVKWNNIWQEVVYGIDETSEFNYLDSDRAQVLDPVQRWQFADEKQFEVWPLPASNAQIRFIGYRALTSLRSKDVPTVWDDNATLDLDSLLVTLYSAAEYLTREESPRAESMARRAINKLHACLGASPQRSETVVIGAGGPMGRRMIRQVPLVLVGGK